MTDHQALGKTGNFGTGEDAERLRRRAFLQRTPQQRLDWLAQALQLAYQRGAAVPFKAQP